MSLNPYTSYAGRDTSLRTQDYVSSDPAGHRSHWSSEYDSSKNGKGNFVEKFSPPSTKTYSPSLRSTNSDLPQNNGLSSNYQPWNRERRNSAQYSESAGSLPSYHDSPPNSVRDLESRGLRGIRKNLDSGNRARVYLFIAMCSGMLLLFLFTALVWLGLGIIKKPLTYGADNHADFTVRPA
ncbi:protein of unknown function [Taphrina deformans PYCC 5710]|uniref:Uncharacterized protein n=1 Tax=Taphrina deformans (strain PYCC 5710 / ATCC 11124 / CBS 356.35 / IMI 108563 / JCM 9778 / NBRC 8474) TaxID=1097556 RepID=R4XBD4_TAPDE|nr:protein of unknown function [Taphrina deformans PYCC 5710]|eukprot:CCG82910.1 protein of unknown function [Taphrina deformans PYCC 5710]